MQSIVPNLATVVLAFSPAVLAVPQQYGTGIVSYTYSTTSSSWPPMGTGTDGSYGSYPTYQPIGTGGTAGTVHQSMTKSSKPVYKPTVTYAQTSRVTTEPESSSSHDQTYSETQSGPSSKPTAYEDFKFGFEDKRTGGPGQGGEVVPANRQTFPALTGTDLGMAATVVSSTVVPENSVVNVNINANDGTTTTPRETLNTFHRYDATVFYQGAVHSRFSPGCGNATLVVALGAQDFGTGQVAQELFGARSNAAVADVDKLRGTISKNVALGVEQCLKRCNINKK
ncbi:hypothetical protein PG994_013198 [Apiospora phragmitis]|uniref:Uncharacterized protein n=1 Tax=Apiospora phragmitis TaxID=2905665 RepID=A0ABR1T7Y7_9PEZI